MRDPLKAPRIAVVFYSATGNVAAMAEALADGAVKEGADVRMRPVPELAPSEAIARNPRWQAWVDDNPYAEHATLDDLEWADGIALGSPTRFGGPAGQLKEFLDSTGGLWAQGKLVDKVGTAFTSASTTHGGLESTILAMNNVLYHWGAIVLPLGYTDEHLMRSGNPYGSSFVSRSSASPDDDALAACRLQGARLARICGYVADGLASVSAPQETVTAAELAALAARLGYRLDAEQVAGMHAAVLAAEPAAARLRERPVDAAVADPAYGDQWLRRPGAPR